MRKNKKTKQEKLRQRLLEIRTKRPRNNFCADCGIKGPTWASYNLGLFLCINCAGFHRRLGTHISKVRSTKLDKWEPDWVKNMSCIGNEVANFLFEGKLPRTEKINEYSSDMVREEFIRAKYERRQWFLNRPLSEMTAAPAPTKPITVPAPRHKAPERPAENVAEEDLLSFNKTVQENTTLGMFDGLNISGEAMPVSQTEPQPEPQPEPELQASEEANLLDFSKPIEQVEPEKDTLEDDLLAFPMAAEPPKKKVNSPIDFDLLNQGESQGKDNVGTRAGEAKLDNLLSFTAAPKQEQKSAFGFLNVQTSAVPNIVTGSQQQAVSAPAPVSTSAFGFVSAAQPTTKPAQTVGNSTSPFKYVSVKQSSGPRVFHGGVGIFDAALKDMRSPSISSSNQELKKKNKISPSKNNGRADPFGNLLAGTKLGAKGSGPKISTGGSTPKKSSFTKETNKTQSTASAFGFI